MDGKRFLWLSLLLPQFAGLLFAAFCELRLLRFDLQGNGDEICGTGAVHFSPFFFVPTVLGLIAVIGLCDDRPWARRLYLVLAVLLLLASAELVLRPPSHSPSFLPVDLIVLCTLAGCLARRDRDGALPEATAGVSRP